ncbi:serine/threonine-protein kinase Nek8-like [Schistocerca nitens]|uniref:serine/threonine-protein kinase Nek8-like n=1 Tax=Schistocerca nitens TaxID=7011 RepID=UPI0021185715|nr:serine/threonine-protein kinase Nek8-like [Schistocerca nitens]
MECYREIRVVGRGSFGAVHLCERRSDGQQVVVKRVSISQMTDSELAASCTEVRVLSMVQHPLVVRYLDSVVQEDALHIVMEYLPGGTLRDFLRARDGRLLPQQDVVTWASQLVLALYHIHSLNVLHRDITSSNILLTANHRCLKIGDFGISKILASKSRAQTLVGTPCYLSPELCDGRDYGRESDIWATGVVIYEMLALRRPFEAPTLASLVMQILRARVPPVSATHYDSTVHDLITIMLHREPKSRPSARQLLAHPALIAAVHAAPVTCFHCSEASYV